MPRSPAYQKPERSGVGPERTLEANTPTPSRTARKLILLPRAYSASGGLIPRNHPKPERSGVRPERALEANTQPPRAKRESSSSSEPTQRAEA